MSDEKDRNTTPDDSTQSETSESAEAPEQSRAAVHRESASELEGEASQDEPATDEGGVPDWMENPMGGYSSEQDDTSDQSEKADDDSVDDEEATDTVELEDRPVTRRGAESDNVDEKPYWMQGEHLEGQDDERVPGYESGEIEGSSTFTLYAFALVGIVAAIKLWLATRIGLGDSEAYYWSWSQHLSLSYYDHPPAIAWLIRLGTSWLGDTPLGVRALSIILLALATLLLYDLGASIFKDRRIGFLAALLFSVCPVFFIGGAAAAPDPALGFAWLLATWLLLRALDKQSNMTMLAVGVVVGLGLLAKYFMVLFWPAALLYLMLGRHRSWLGSRWLWFAILASLALFTPVLLWNMGHDWASFTYHLIGRHGAAGFDKTRLLMFLGGQALYLSPLIAIGLILSVIRVTLDTLAGRTRWHGLLFWFSVPVLALFITLGAWTPEAEPHWPMIGYLLLFIVLADYVIGMSTKPVSNLTAYILTGPVTFLGRPTSRGIALGWMLVPALLLNAVFFIHILTDEGFAFLPADYNPKLDISNELVGWPQVGEAAGEILAKMPDDAFISSYHYTMCGQFAFATRTLNRQLACLSPQTDAYDFWDTPKALEGRDALIVTDNRYNHDPATLYDCGGGIRQEKQVTITRAQRTVRTFTLWVCNDYRGMLPEGAKPTPTAPAVEPQPAAPQATEAPAAEAPPAPALDLPVPAEQQPPLVEQQEAPAPSEEPAPSAPDTAPQPVVPAEPSEQPQPADPTEPQIMEL